MLGHTRYVTFFFSFSTTSLYLSVCSVYCQLIWLCCLDCCRWCRYWVKKSSYWRPLSPNEVSSDRFCSVFHFCVIFGNVWEKRNKLWKFGSPTLLTVNLALHRSKASNLADPSWFTMVVDWRMTGESSDRVWERSECDYAKPKLEGRESGEGGC